LNGESPRVTIARGRENHGGHNLLHMEKFSRLLLPSEKLLWTGKPGGGLLFSRMDFILIPFSLLWGGFAIFWEYQVITMPHARQSAFFILWGIPFIALGLYVTVGRFVVDAYARSKTFYAITDSRLLIVREGILSGIQVFQLNQLPAASFEGPTSGMGTLDLSGSTPNARSFAAWTPALAKGARLLKIENAWQVFTLLQQAQRQSRTAST
jgi:hypothetical protein